MAIAIERKTRSINWLALSIGLFVLLFVAFVVYFLFLAEVPLIDKFVPEPTIEGASGLVGVLSDPSIDPNAVVNSVASFQDTIPQPDTGKLGRPNPFQPI